MYIDLPRARGRRRGGTGLGVGRRARQGRLASVKVAFSCSSPNVCGRRRAARHDDLMMMRLLAMTLLAFVASANANAPSLPWTTSFSTSFVAGSTTGSLMYSWPSVSTVTFCDLMNATCIILSSSSVVSFTLTGPAYQPRAGRVRMCALLRRTGRPVIVCGAFFFL